MKVTHSLTSARRKFAVTAAGIARTLIALVVVAVVLVALLFIVRPELAQQAIKRVETRWGYVFRSVDAGLTDSWSIALGVYLREALDGVPDIPELVIDVPFKEISKIYAKREEALARGILVQGPDDFVKGEIRIDDRVVPIKLRLKGDWNDHLAGRKWSFRIRTRGGEQLFGMRRFSIQNPNTRGFQSELMYFEALKRYDVMSPRYRFVQVTLNGESMGLMALEEFFSKELLEYSRRREGVIVRFDESYAWDSRDAITGEAVGWGGAFDDYRNAEVDAFGSSRIAESATLSKQYRVAEGLLNGFADGALSASEVFDVERLGAFLAVSDMFGSWHAVAWHNLRFYLNPVTLRLEPIAFDATLQDRFTDAASVISDEPVAIAMLADPLVRQRYKEVLDDLRTRYEDGSLPDQLRGVEDEHLALLQTEFRMLTRFPIDYLSGRLDALLASDGDYAFRDDREQDQYAVLAHFRYTENELQIETAIPREVEVRAASWIQPQSGEQAVALDWADLPLRLPARGVGSAPVGFTLPLLNPPDPDVTWRLEIEAGLPGRDWSRRFSAGPAAQVLTERPLPAADTPLPEFFVRENDTLRIRPGEYRVEASVVTPPGIVVSVDAGTTLRFANDALMLVNGPLRVQGTEDAPVRFVPLDSSWPGIVVMEADDRSQVAFAEFRSTHSVTTDSWTLTGGVNFYAADVDIRDTLFADSRGEDALNIINSDYTLQDITVDGTVSDAFDGDFTTGRVSGGLFTNVGRAGGGDAVDVSGSTIQVSGTRFTRIADKALSVGERSTMNATGVVMQDVGTAAAAKDGSLLELSDASISRASFAGLTAYIKKPEYGPAEIRAKGVTIAETAQPTLVQTGSRVTIDNVEQQSEDVDVDALYETVMKPGLRR
ncbi:MAG: hypothetical protein HKN56_02900 [Gammaproteobacteria bacterium]|nr:hypothetical protein [Gammaproteobacteria bacterium]